MKKGFGITIGMVLLAFVIGAILLSSWFFEGEPPQVNLSPKPQVIGKESVFELEVSDSKRGLRRVSLWVKQGEVVQTLMEEDLTKQGSSGEDLHLLKRQVIFRPLEKGLKGGRAILSIVAHDRSLRNGGDVNRSSIEWEVEIDTTPPFVRAVTPYHYYSMGGTGVVVYQTAEDSTESGVRCGDQFYRGFRAKDRQGLWICFFPIPQEHTSKDRCQLYSKDRAGNETQTQFSYQIRPKKFRSDSITITEDFLKGIYPYFESIGIGNTQGQLVEWFKFINGKQREMDESKFSQMAKSTHEEALWEGVFLRMKDAAPMAGFGDRRSYKYGGQIIGDSVHKGVDLASLEHSPVEAANSGRVAFTGDLGIYGKTIILDHGQGIFSSYSHLSEIKVEVGQRISKGQVIGRTGKTGLAGGDHLHFGIMVQGVFVNPIEWWDPLWIREKISRWIEPEGKEATEAGPKEAGEGPGKKKPLRGKRS